MTLARRAALLGGAAALLAPAAAGAAPVADGVDAFSTAIAPDGTALIAYKTGGTSGNALGFCRLPFRTATCQTSVPPVPQVLPPEGGVDVPSRVDGLQLLRRPADGLLVLLTTTFDVTAPDDVDRQTFVTTSADAGTTWTPQTQIGIGQGPLLQAALTPDGAAVDLVDDGPADAKFSRLPLAGPPAAPVFQLAAGAEDVTQDESLVTEPDGTVVVGFSVDGRYTLRRLPAGADPATGWTPLQRVRAGASSGYRLLGSSRGTFLFSTRSLSAQIRADYTLPLERRRVTATGTGPRLRFADRSTLFPAAVGADALGGQHVAFLARGGRSALLYLRNRGRRARCSYGAQTRIGRFILARALVRGPQVAAATPKRVVVTVNTRSGLQAIFARGGDRPKPRPRQNC